jgi:hypothetical protein
MITGVTVAAKTLCDSYCTNSHYARVGGISVSELNTLELELLFLLDWNLWCDKVLLEKYYTHLVESSGLYYMDTHADKSTEEKLDTYDAQTYLGR